MASCAIGSDSRLSADGDLLDEIRTAVKIRKAWLQKKRVPQLAGKVGVPPERTHLSSLDYKVVVDLVTSQSAKFLKIDGAGQLRNDAYADFLVIQAAADSAKALCHSSRADLALVVKGGVPQIGDPEVMAKFTHVETVSATLDGVPKLIQIDLARRILKCSLKEPGLEILEKPERQRMFGWI